ncbi:MAG: FlgD immunoglobulin-like domain containing protein, partial [Bacteroidota bacterium]
YAAALLRKSVGLPIIADVKVVDTQVPNEYALNQNYPNPFNPTTNISFSLPQQEHVKIEIYNVLGDLVKTLADQVFAPGTIAITWDGMDDNGTMVASGMYIYRLRAGSFSAAKKMAMLK